MRCTESRASRRTTAAQLSACFSKYWHDENCDRIPSLFYLPEIFEMNYRPGVGTITPATAGTPDTCRSQKATHPRQPPPLDVQKRTQCHLLNRINMAFPRPCQAENQAAVPCHSRFENLLAVYVHAPRLNSFFPCWTL